MRANRREAMGAMGLARGSVMWRQVAGRWVGERRAALSDPSSVRVLARAASLLVSYCSAGAATEVEPRAALGRRDGGPLC
ncbi:hypothetical protein [Kitasatospora sp. NPDC058190]|uniref:hypothetical protein n=1 Tax=Kitasatospora sp. NPDC058190 TaxID=3346371 RepID=UPI0036DCB63C